MGDEEEVRGEGVTRRSGVAGIGASDSSQLPLSALDSSSGWEGLEDNLRRRRGGTALRRERSSFIVVWGGGE